MVVANREAGIGAAEGNPRFEWGLVIHGGVGVIPRREMSEEVEVAYREVLAASLRAGHGALERGGSAVDAVVAAIVVMEDSPLFNAGRGSNLTAEGEVSMDAALMIGDTREAGAVAGVRTVRNPIELARAVMERSGHVMLAGEGAEAFAAEVGLAREDPEYFLTERRWKALLDAKRREAEGEERPNTVDLDERAGTVGAVALDRDGLLVAGTSTGGSANKKWGRVGDSPIIGAGTYAGRHAAVSCTGWGEYFIRYTVAHDVEARMAYSGVPLKEAVRQVVLEELEAERPGLGGLVALDRAGHVEMCYNTEGMYRGWVDEGGALQVEIF